MDDVNEKVAYACCSSTLAGEPYNSAVERAKNGSVEAMLLLSEHHFATGGPDANAKGMALLERAYDLDPALAVGALVYTRLAQGECKKAEQALVGVRTSRGLKSISELREVVADCYDRPLGKGDWASRID